MGNVLVNDTYLYNMADALREKYDTDKKYLPSEMAEAVRNLYTITNNSSGQCINTSTNKTYSNIINALNEVSEDETIQLLENGEVSLVCIPANVVLDLNGYALTADNMLCQGHIVDYSDENTGILNISKEHFLIQKNNAQLPIRNGEGYQFFEVEKFNEKYRSDYNDYVFQPFIESKSHMLFKQNYEQTGISMYVYIKYMYINEDFFRYALVELTKEGYIDFLNSYNSSTDKYSSMRAVTFTATLENLSYLKYDTRIFSNTGVEFKSNGKMAVGEEENTTFNLRNDDWIDEVVDIISLNE